MFAVHNKFRDQFSKNLVSIRVICYAPNKTTCHNNRFSGRATDNNDAFVVYDSETTGLMPSNKLDGGAELVEIGAIIVTPKGKVLNRFHRVIPNQNRYRNNLQYRNYQSLHNTKPKLASDVMPELQRFIGNHTIWAHNAQFDKRFFDHYMSKAGLQIQNPWLCTCKLSRRLFPHAPDYRLSTLCDYLNIDLSKEHRFHQAMDDAMVTADIITHIYEQIFKYSTIKPTLPLLQLLENTPVKSSINLLKSLESHNLAVENQINKNRFRQ